ncbi:glycosyltransferase [Aestuariivirga sp.]|uniref:glycosyltransferase n=1 Tax=Aestuariivirga sp. TaxID=2650926 RepID=UPI003BAC6152
MKLLVIFKTFGHYHRSRIAALRSRFEVIAVEITTRDPDSGWVAPEQDPTIVSLNASKSSSVRLIKIFVEIISLHRPDVVAIPGWFEPFATAAIFACSILKVPTILMSDTWIGKRLRLSLVDSVKRRIIHTFSSAVVAGSPHTNFLISRGYPLNAIWDGFDVVDNTLFMRDRDASVNIPLREPYFFVCSRLVSEKNVEGIIIALSKFFELEPQAKCRLVIAGDGPLLSNLIELAQARLVKDRIDFLGRVRYEKLPSLYSSSLALILNSNSETWGLVVNEAMASGTPIIVSENVGCRVDLVEHGGNGFIVPPNDSASLARYMQILWRSDSLRRKFGVKSQTLIAHWGLDRFVTSMELASRFAVRNRREVSAVDRLLLLGLSFRCT